MTYLLSLLDKAPVEAGATAADALVAAVKLAIAVEEFGYHRFWAFVGVGWLAALLM